jgi:hypothetical protein
MCQRRRGNLRNATFRNARDLEGNVCVAGRHTQSCRCGGRRIVPFSSRSAHRRRGLALALGVCDSRSQRCDRGGEARHLLCDPCSWRWEGCADLDLLSHADVAGICSVISECVAGRSREIAISNGRSSARPVVHLGPGMIRRAIQVATPAGQMSGGLM